MKKKKIVSLLLSCILLVGIGQSMSVYVAHDQVNVIFM